MLMKALKINRHLAIRFALGALILCLSTTVIAIHSVYADTVIDGSLVQKVGDFRADNYGIQGGTISEKYYIFADSNSHGSTNGRTTIRFFDRKSGKEVSADSSLIMQDFKHASSLHYDWGTGYAQVGDASTGNWWCFSVKNRKQVSESKCKNGFLTSSGLGYGNTRQGWTKFGDYYFRAVGNEYDEGANITVYDKDRNFVENYVVPLSATDVCEIEDVAVDGNEGVLYMLCDDKAKGHYAGFYKIDKSVFSNYITASNEKRTAKNSAAKEKDASDYEKEAYVPSVSTYDGVVETTFFGTMQDDKEGCGVYTTLDLIMTILTIGIGISAAIGIAVSGIIYLTAKGDVAKTTKAKRRIYEIVIGLAAYAVIWALLTFLLPEFNPELKACKTLTAEEIAARDARIAAIRAENAKRANPGGVTDESTEKCLKNAAKVVRNQVCKLKTPAERISATAKLLAGSSGAPNAKYRQAMKETGANSSGPCEVNGESCNTFVATVLLASGVDPNVPNGKAGNNTADLYNYFSKSPKWKKVGNSPGLSREGDVVVKPRPNGHVTITVKKPTGQLVTAHASYCDFYPIVSNSIFDDYDGTPTVFRYIGK